MVGLPVVLLVGMAWLGLSALRGISTSVVLAALAGGLALLGVMVAPQRPGVGERLAQVASVVAVVAFGAELAGMTGKGVDAGGGCLPVTAVVGVLSSAMMLTVVARSGLPMRWWHRMGVAVAGVLGGCTAVWHHCASDQLVHRVLLHALGPLAVVVTIVVVGGWWCRARPGWGS